MHDVSEPLPVRTRNGADEFRGLVVVITGASSGIGLATALAFAQRGALVALLARRTEALQHAAARCEQAGGAALVVTADVTDAGAMQQAAQTVLERFGTIDVWINNAGVGLLGPFAGAELEVHRRVVETNLFGTMHGAAAVLPHFLQQKRGLLITNISVGGFVPAPFAAAYTASKFAMRGFIASLRQELRHVPGIRLCSVFPATVDTPGFTHGANVSGRELRPGWTVLSPEQVAEVMVGLVRRPRDEVGVGWPTSFARIAYALAPLTTERVAGSVMRSYLRRGARAADTRGALFEPMREGTGTRGGWKHPLSSTARRKRQAVVAGLVAAGAAWLASRLAR